MDKLSIRSFEESDFDDVVAWWKARGWPAEAKDQVSQMGFMILSGETKVCAGWLFLTNGPWAWLEFIVSNPDAPLRDRRAGLEYLVSFALSVAKAAGHKIVTTNLTSKGLMRLFEKCGFVKGDVGVTNMIARVN